LVLNGELERGREIVQALGVGESYGASRGLAMFRTLCGDIDVAAEWWEKAIHERDISAPLLLQSVLGEPLRASRHWPRLLALMNLPTSAGTSTP
jgi:hypothetical protein